MYNDIIFLVNDRLSSGDHMKDVSVVEIYLHPFDVMVMTQDDGDKLIFISFDPRCLYYTPIQSVGDTCTLGNTHSKQPNYRPYGLCVNHKKTWLLQIKVTKAFTFRTVQVMRSERSSCHLVLDRHTWHQIPLAATLLQTPLLTL